MVYLVKDGKYKIFNAKYTNYGVDLIHGNKHGTVSLHVEDGTVTNHRDWKLMNIGNNQFVLESIAAPGAYASASAEDQGVSLTGAQTPTIWVLLPIALNQYVITTTDGKYAWCPPSGHNYETIVLQLTTEVKGRLEAQWSFLPIR